jgi:hypothetical protein
MSRQLTFPQDVVPRHHPEKSAAPGTAPMGRRP